MKRRGPRWGRAAPRMTYERVRRLPFRGIRSDIELLGDGAHRRVAGPVHRRDPVLIGGQELALEPRLDELNRRTVIDEHTRDILDQNALDILEHLESLFRIAQESRCLRQTLVERSLRPGAGTARLRAAEHVCWVEEGDAGANA